MRPYYEHGGIAIYNANALEWFSWVHADVLVTDPPYGMAYKSGWSERSIVNDEDTEARDEALRLWGDRPALVFGRWNCPHPEKARMVLTWDKGDWPGMGDLSLPWGPSTEEIYVLGSGFNGRRAGSVIRVDRLTGDTAHPNEKPLDLMLRLIKRCPPGMIADPFMGSGTTLRAVVTRKPGAGVASRGAAPRRCSRREKCWPR